MRPFFFNIVEFGQEKLAVSFAYVDLVDLDLKKALLLIFGL